MSEFLLEMCGIKKSFGSTQALKNVELKVKAGEVHMLLGENGAGKSTLMKILAGSQGADDGKIIWKGKEVHLNSPTDSFHLGIGMVYQELSIIDDLSITENVLLGQLPRKNGLIDWKAAHDTTRKLLSDVGLLHINPKDKMKNYALGIKQLVEICKALSKQAQLVILDEPTSSLTESETEDLFRVIANLKKQNVAFIYITHKLDEVFEIGDSVTVFRDGAKVGETKSASEVTEEDMIHDMVGRTITEFYPKEKNVQNEVLLEVKDLTDYKVFQNVSFSLKKGEVLGVAGLVGSGRSEMMDAIFGLTKKFGGKVLLHKQELHIKSPQDSLRHKIGLLTKNRKSGLALHMPIATNITISAFGQYMNGPLRDKKAELRAANNYIEKLKIATTDANKKVGDLSGGNQQKVAIAKLLCAGCEIFLMNDPTRGVDVGAKVEIYKIINELTRKGAGIIFISSEMPELLGMSDRILVARDGKIVADLDITECSQEIVMQRVAGGI